MLFREKVSVVLHAMRIHIVQCIVDVTVEANALFFFVAMVTIARGKEIDQHLCLSFISTLQFPYKSNVPTMAMH